MAVSYFEVALNSISNNRFYVNTSKPALPKTFAAAPVTVYRCHAVVMRRLPHTTSSRIMVFAKLVFTNVAYILWSIIPETFPFWCYYGHNKSFFTSLLLRFNCCPISLNLSSFPVPWQFSLPVKPSIKTSVSHGESLQNCTNKEGPTDPF